MSEDNPRPRRQRPWRPSDRLDTNDFELQDPQRKSAAISEDASMTIGPDPHSTQEEYDQENDGYASSVDAASIKSSTEEDQEVKKKDGDEEKGRPTTLTRKDTQQSKREQNPDLVVWESDEDPENPLNWRRNRKWAATVTVSCFTFISPLSSTVIAPAGVNIAQDLGITNEVVSNVVLSVFVLAFALGPLFLGPLSEIYGRVIVLQLANAFFLVFNLVCGFAQNQGQMIAFRFLAGLGGSAPLTIGGGVVSDLWRPAERGKALAMYSLAPLLGPAIGPIVGGFIAQHTSWRWAFYATSIADAVIQVFGLIFLQETYAPKLLKRKAARIRSETGNQKLHTEYDSQDQTLLAKLRTNLTRPFIMLLTQPIVQVLAVYQAFLYGLVYLVISSFPTLWGERYHMSMEIGGLHFIALGIGYFLGAQIGGRCNDLTFRWLRKRNNGTGKPEFRCPIMIPGALLVPIGLFIYGWSAQAKTHWIVPDIGAAIFSAGIVIGFQSIQAYTVDSYTRYAASAIAAITVLRSIGGFGFPLFAPYLYKGLDYGWGNSLIAFVGIALGIPAPFLLYFYGAKLRAKSQFAAG